MSSHINRSECIIRGQLRFLIRQSHMKQQAKYLIRVLINAKFGMHQKKEIEWDEFLLSFTKPFFFYLVRFSWMTEFVIQPDNNAS